MPDRLFSRLPILLGALLIGLAAVGCGSSRPAETGRTDRGRSSAASMPALPADTVESQLRQVSARWRGVPHEWGGTSRRGIDCSALVQTVYRSALSVSVPRTTDEQARIGTRVDRSALQPGDLVFFLPSRRKPHVGIYLSDGEFVHASSSSGVTVSRLDRSYWTDTWWQARRVLRLAGADSTGTPATAPRRSGW